MTSPKTIVYILKASTQGCFSLRTADTNQEFLHEVQTSEKLGYQLFRSYHVSEALSNETYGLCVDFVTGKTSLDTLTEHIAQLLLQQPR